MESRQNLHDSLVAQACALGETGRLGHRNPAILALGQAIQLQPSAAARTWLSSALAMADLQEVRRWRSTLAVDWPLTPLPAPIPPAKWIIPQPFPF